MKILHGVRGDDGREKLAADSKPNLGQESVHANLFDDSAQAIAGTQTRQRILRMSRAGL